MRLVTSWRIAVRSASFWSSSIFWFWTSWAAATASSWSCSTWRSSRRDSRASRCASFSERRSWSAIACCSERMVSMSARLWMLESRSNQSRSPVLYRVAARLARIWRCRSSSFSARLRSMRERVRRWLTSSSFGLRPDQVVADASAGRPAGPPSRCASAWPPSAARRGRGRPPRAARPRRPRPPASRGTPRGAPRRPPRGGAASHACIWGGWTCLRPCRCPACSASGIGPAGRFLTAGQAGAVAPACTGSFAPAARIPLMRVAAGGLRRHLAAGSSQWRRGA